MNAHRLIIGTRGSTLALTQAGWVKARLEARHPDLSVTLEIIKTKGDKILDVPLAKVGGKGLFVKEIEDALLAGQVDLAVHSMKDVPTELPAGLFIAAVPEREDFRDVLVSKQDLTLDRLPAGARVGTSSLRRQAQLLHRRPDLRIVNLRGNLDTRLKKLAGPEYEAIVVAAAGLARMNLSERATEFLNPKVLLPAIGQGALGLEARKDDLALMERIAFLHHPATATGIRAERAFLETMGGGCQVPMAALARLGTEDLTLTGLVASPDGTRLLTSSRSAHPDQADQLGRELARELLERGGREILAETL